MCISKLAAACLDFHRTCRPIRTASVTQVRQPIYRQSVARWKNYEGYLADLFGTFLVDKFRSERCRAHEYPRRTSLFRKLYYRWCC
jgi:hypothetical protein